LPTCREQRVTYLVLGISDLELESTFLEYKNVMEIRADLGPGSDFCGFIHRFHYRRKVDVLGSSGGCIHFTGVHRSNVGHILVIDWS
jgi:hypothetical protein